MKFALFIILLIFLTHAENGLIHVEYIDTIYNRYSQKNIERKVISSIESKDSVPFYNRKHTTIYSKEKYLHGTTRIFVNGILKQRGEINHGRRIGEWKVYDSTGVVKKVDHYDKKIGLTKSDHYKGEVKESTKQFRNPLFHNYRLGIQPPTLIDFSSPTNVTLSSINFHCDIPMPQYGIKKRAQFVAASEVGLHGVAARVGLSPYMKDPWLNKVFNFTPITVNSSFTYIWNDTKYDRLPNLQEGRWYVGGDIDVSYILGHVRLGAMRLMGPEKERPWQFMFSVGISPGLLFFPLWLPMAG